MLNTQLFISPPLHALAPRRRHSPRGPASSHPHGPSARAPFNQTHARTHSWTERAGRATELTPTNLCPENRHTMAPAQPVSAALLPSALQGLRRAELVLATWQPPTSRRSRCKHAPEGFIPREDRFGVPKPTGLHIPRGWCS